MGVAWNSSSSAASEVLYGNSPTPLSKKATGKSTKSTAAKLLRVHEVNLTGLAPSTKYYYKAGSPGAGYSKVYSFKTGAPAQDSCGKFRFLALGDNRFDPLFTSYFWWWPAISKEIVTENAALVINGGDIVHDGKKESEWVTVFDKTDPLAPFVPIMPAVGNHDDGPGEGDKAHYNQLYYLPRASKTIGGSGTEDYYYFIYGNAIFVSISTSTFNSGSPPFKDQAIWLDKVLANHSKKRWKFVFLHHPIYTTYIKTAIFETSPPNERKQNAALVPIFDKHHVDVVFQSHVHWYERFKPSKCNSGKDTPCVVNSFAQGTVYITTGGAGAFNVPLCFWPASPARVVCSSLYHYVIVDIDNEKMTLKTKATKAGNLAAGGTMIDKLTITKSGNPCSATPDAGTPTPDAGTPASDGPHSPDVPAPLDAPPGADIASPKKDTSIHMDIAGTGDGPKGDSQAAWDRALAPDSSGGQGNTTPGAAEGCNCALQPDLSAPPTLLLAALLVLLLIRRPRRIP